MKGGIERLREVNFYRPESQLKEHAASIEDYLTKNPPVSISHAVAMIEELTGIKRGETQVRHFLKSLGFRFRKVGTIPAKADTDIKMIDMISFAIYLYHLR